MIVRLVSRLFLSFFANMSLVVYVMEVFLGPGHEGEDERSGKREQASVAQQN